MKEQEIPEPNDSLFMTFNEELSVLSPGTKVPESLEIYQLIDEANRFLIRANQLRRQGNVPIRFAICQYRIPSLGPDDEDA